MKNVGWVILVLTIGVLGWLLVNQHTVAAEARATAAALEADRDQALAQARANQAAADSAAQRADSLTMALDVERLRSRERIREIQTEVDSLQGQLVNLVPPGPLQDSVRVLVASIEQRHEAQLAQLGSLLTLSDSTVAALRRQAMAQEAVSAQLREALTLTTRQRDLFERAANPGLMDRLREDAALLTGAFAGGLLVALVMGSSGG